MTWTTKDRERHIRKRERNAERQKRNSERGRERKERLSRVFRGMTQFFLRRNKKKLVMKDHF